MRKVDSNQYPIHWSPLYLVLRPGKVKEWNYEHGGESLNFDRGLSYM